MSVVRHRGVSGINRVLVEGCRVTFILFLAVLVSGMVPMLIQTYGWYDMARKAGGMDQIVQVVTEAPACEFCKAAQEMQQKSEPGPDNAPGRDRVETVKVYALSPGLDRFLTSRPEPSAPGAWRVAGDEALPESLAHAPSTPPPEWLV